MTRDELSRGLRCSSEAGSVTEVKCCGICGAAQWVRYPDPHPAQSLLSDFRCLNEPLAKCGCGVCGTVHREPIGDHDSLFRDYELYAHDAGDSFELERQRRYARWLASVLGTPLSAFEGGAGNGSLQLALREIWQSTNLWGVEPASEAVRRSRRAGAAVAVGFVTAGDRPLQRADLAFAVNVIEHVADPVAFVAGLAQHAVGRVAIVCPDGSEPWTELLFVDHLRSLSGAAVCEVFRQAGLTVEHQERAPADLGKFMLTVGHRAPSRPAAPMVQDTQLLHVRRTNYLDAWAQLDAALTSRAPSKALVCFGAGEAAALLRTYAPGAWAAVEYCTVDGGGEKFGPLAVLPYSGLERSHILLGVQPAAQERLAARLRADGHEAVRWDDLIPA